MTRFCLAFLMTCAWGEASYAVDREHQRARSMLETMLDDVTLWVQPDRARTPTHHRFELSEKTSFTTMILENDYKTA